MSLTEDLKNPYPVIFLEGGGVGDYDKIQVCVVTVSFAYLELFWDFVCLVFVWDSFLS